MADTEDQVTDSGEEKEVTTPSTPKSEPKPKEEEKTQPKEESTKAEVKGRPNFDFI